MTPSIRTCEITTVRSYLTNRAVMAGEDYAITPDCALGIQWDNTYNCTPGNIKHIHAPLLVMGMTGSYEYLAAEVVYDNAASTDKRIAFVEGAGHNFDNQGRQEFGDTQKVVFDYVDRWLSAEGRF
jgi:esterase/lipase